MARKMLGSFWIGMETGRSIPFLRCSGNFTPQPNPPPGQQKNGFFGDLEQIQFLLGHASVQMTERYLGSRNPVSRQSLFRHVYLDAEPDVGECHGTKRPDAGLSSWQRTDSAPVWSKILAAGQQPRAIAPHKSPFSKQPLCHVWQRCPMSGHPARAPHRRAAPLGSVPDPPDGRSLRARTSQPPALERA